MTFNQADQQRTYIFERHIRNLSPEETVAYIYSGAITLQKLVELHYERYEHVVELLREERVWHYAMNYPSYFVFDNYLKRYPNGKYRHLADRELRNIAEKHFDAKDLEFYSPVELADFIERNEISNDKLIEYGIEERTYFEVKRILSRHKEECFWEDALKAKNTEYAMHDYLRTYPNGCHCLEAECYIEEERNWKESYNSQLRRKIRQYIKKYPNGIHTQEAIQNLNWMQKNSKGIESFHPAIPQKKYDNKSFWARLFSKKSKLQDVYSSVFAPSEVKQKSRMMVQVYLHLNEETEKVKALATEADRNAERRDYIPLQTKLKKGDKVDVVLNINGNTLLYNSSKSIIWKGSFCKYAFDYLVPSDLDIEELSCSVNLYVNGAIVGEMLFYTQIVDSPAQLNANVIAKPVKKLFISYSHNDLKSVEKIAKLYEGMDVDVFFDKHRLKSGYIYSEEIFNFINKADTFVLCWSENAAQSEYVEKERKAALELAYPNRKPRDLAPISIKPYNIPPYATPPEDMIEHYHFEEL